MSEQWSMLGLEKPSLHTKDVVRKPFLLMDCYAMEERLALARFIAKGPITQMPTLPRFYTYTHAAWVALAHMAWSSIFRWAQNNYMVHLVGEDSPLCPLSNHMSRRTALRHSKTANVFLQRLGTPSHFSASVQGTKLLDNGTLLRAIKK